MYEIDKKNFRIFVAERRKEKGYTQKELAEKLFISDKAISKWETGMSIPDAALWIPLSDLLGVTVTELLMCHRIEESDQMSSTQVETLVKKAIRFSDENPVAKQAIKRQRIFLFSVCVLVSCIENLFIYVNGFMSGTILLFDFMGVIFGVYFYLLAKEKLPAYYDENKITTYSDGIFRLNVAGLALNNSNWPHILRVIRISIMVMLVGYPIIFGIMQKLLPTAWSDIEPIFAMILMFGGLFIPIYKVGKKYQ